MATEIERKWLVVGDPPIDRALRTTQIQQGYLDGVDDAEIRVRVCRPDPFTTPDDFAPWAEITLKRVAAIQAIDGPQVRDEFTWRVAVDMGETLLAACAWRLSKTRHVLPVDYGDTLAAPYATALAAAKLRWEVDVYGYAPSGQQLRVVELELPRADFPLPPLPSWIGAEVTGEPLYSNRTLAGGDTAERWQRHVDALEAIAGAPLSIGVTPGHVARVDARDRAALAAAIASGNVKVRDRNAATRDADAAARSMADVTAPAPHYEALAARAAQLTAARLGGDYAAPAVPWPAQDDAVAWAQHVAALERIAGKPIMIQMPDGLRGAIATLLAGGEPRPTQPIAEPKSLPPGYVATPHGAARVIAQAPPVRDADAVVDLGAGPDGKPRRIAVSGGPDDAVDEAELALFQVDPAAAGGEVLLTTDGTFAAAPRADAAAARLAVQPDADGAVPLAAPALVAGDGELVWNLGDDS